VSNTFNETENQQLHTMGLDSVEASNPASYFNVQAHTHTDSQANQTKANDDTSIS
jgi:hypothetical protein